MEDPDPDPDPSDPYLLPAASCEALIARLATFIERGGAEPFLAAPILEPTHRCFPDRWTPDAEGARTLLVRLMNYARLPDLDVSVQLFSQQSWAPAHLLDATAIADQARAGAAALFAGIHEGVGYFGVDVHQLDDPQRLVGILAHETAHAWRRLKGIEDDDLATEEKLTDLTTVSLGFGVMTVNASYVYRSSGGLRYTQWSHARAGYLSPQAMSFLLAAQVVARNQDHRRIQKMLEPNQRAYFEAACEALDREALIEALKLGRSSDWPAPWPATAGPLRHPLSRVQRRIREVSRAFECDSAGTMVDGSRAVPCEFHVAETRHRNIGVWGSSRAGNRWTCRLSLVEDPELAAQLVVAMITAGDTPARTVAFGILSEKVVSKPKSQRDGLRPLFAANGHPDHPLLIGLPSFVAYPKNPAMGLGDMSELLLLSARHVDLASLPVMIEEEELRKADPWSRSGPEPRRLGSNREAPSGNAAAPSDRQATRLLRQWWDIIIEPRRAQVELAAFEAAERT
jgi:hypothetical protein